ncbi:MAG: phosphate-starvation-inducible PsiE family protein [Eubacteriaceae bacterium]
MKKKLIKFMQILEMVIAFFILGAVIVAIVSLSFDLFNYIKNPEMQNGFNTFLGTAFGVIIGIEFLKMLFKHTPGAVIEVLLFAISRQLVVEHTTSFENLLGVIAIALIFFIRKYLYVSVFYDDSQIEKTQISEKIES